MSKPWGSKIGAWAADSERAEAEELATAATTFPTLREAVSAPKQKTKKTNKMSLQEFTMGPATSHHRLTPSEMLRLPTGPMERSSEEMQNRQGYNRGPRHAGYENDDRRASGPSRVSEFDNMPSRADEADNWGTGKKKLTNFDSGRTNNNKYASLGSGLGGSRADDVDNWGAGKKASVPAFGSGFRDPGTGGFERTRLVLDPGGSRADDVDNWGAGKRSTFRDSGTGGIERRRLVLDPRNEVGSVVVGNVKGNKSSPFGAARPREEVLAEKGLDWKKMELEIEAKKGTSRPGSEHSSRPTSSHSNRSGSVEGGVVKVRVKVNPFGDAKPREVLLQEKGLDWRKIDLDLDHRRVDRPETDAEKILKEKIDHLKKDLAQSVSNATRESHEGATDDLRAIIISKEKELESLIRELDDKVRFGPRVNKRPGSGAGRTSRPPSRSGSFDESRNTEFMERPRSRGTGDMWSRQSEDRRAFQGGIERGFMGNRGMDRPRSRERW